jgi:glutamate N-acetyltransferase/amino-acid N-acetyltransferase
LTIHLSGCPRRALKVGPALDDAIWLNGGDPYWGRVLSELGASGAFLDPEKVDIAYNEIIVCRDGIACAHDAASLARVMGGSEIMILCDLRMGHGEASVWTTDLSHAYIDENRRTS